MAETQSQGLGPRRGSTLLSGAFPGLPQLLSGRLVAGGCALALWIGTVSIAVFRWERVVAAPGGAWDQRAALVTLLVAGVGVWAWSLRDVRKGSRRAPEAEALAAFRRSRVALAGAVAVVALHLLALLAPFIAPFDPALQGDLLGQRLSGPSGEHLLGTDQYARDVLSRLLYGARVSLSIGFAAVAIAVAVGTFVGAVAGYAGGKLDAVLMRSVDVVIAFPRLVLLITVIAIFEPSMTLVVVVLGLTQWPRVARLVRGEVLSLREREFVQAGRALGFSRGRIVGRHVIPNVLAPVIIVATLGIGDTIVLEAGLSFLGFGVQPPTASWGIMVAEGRSHLLGAWWLTTFPGLAIVFTVLSFNLVGDGLRDALDPRLRTSR